MHRHSRLPPFPNGHRPRGCLTRTLSSMPLSDLIRQSPNSCKNTDSPCGRRLRRGSTLGAAEINNNHFSTSATFNSDCSLS